MLIAKRIEAGEDTLAPWTREQWAYVCGAIRDFTEVERRFPWSYCLRPLARLLSPGSAALLDANVRARRQLVTLARTMLLDWPELDLEVPDDIRDDVSTVDIPPWAYLRSVLVLAWECFRHPLSESTINLSTGRLIGGR